MWVWSNGTQPTSASSKSPKSISSNNSDTFSISKLSFNCSLWSSLVVWLLSFISNKTLFLFGLDSVSRMGPTSLSSVNNEGVWPEPKTITSTNFFGVRFLLDELGVVEMGVVFIPLLHIGLFEFSLALFCLDVLLSASFELGVTWK